MQKADAIRKLGERIKVLSAIRDHCNPSDDALHKLWIELAPYCGNEFDSINLRAMLSIVLRDGLERGMKECRSQIQEVARSMADPAPKTSTANAA